MEKDKLIQKLLTSSLTKEESHALILWLKDEKSDAYFSGELDEIHHSKNFKFDLPEHTTKALKDSILKKIREEKLHEVDSQSKKKVVGRFIITTLSVAASFLMLLGLGWFILINNDGVETESPVEELITKSNPYGIKTRIHLNDGSLVYLNSGSSIQYKTDFKNNREIQLKGEAFFDVAKDEIHPFKVTTKDFTTTALGTSFNIKSFENEVITELVLASGRVKVENPTTKEELVLDSGEGVLANATDEGLTKFIPDLIKAMYWKEGVLHFEKVPFMKMATTLERWYGVEIEVNGSFPTSGNFSGTFQNNETLVNVLEAMKYAHDFEYKTMKKKVLIKFNN